MRGFYFVLGFLTAVALTGAAPSLGDSVARLAKQLHANDLNATFQHLADVVSKHGV